MAVSATAELSSRSATATALLVALVAGCSASEVWLDLPPLPAEVQGWVIAARSPARVELYAADRDHPARLYAEGADLELRALDVPLVELGLPPGYFESDPSANARELPSASATYATSVDLDGHAEPWHSIDAPDLTAGVRVAARDACAALSARVIEPLPTTNDVHWGVTVDARTVLLGARENSLIRVRAGTKPVTLPIMTSTIVRSTAALLDDRGTLWLVDDRLGLWSARVDEDRVLADPVIASSTVSAGFAVVLDGDVARPDQELYTVTSRGVVLRRSGDRWVRLGALPSDGTDGISHDLVWLGDGHVIASVDTEHPLYRWRGGELDRVDPLTTSRAGVVALARLAPGVAVAATSDGELSRYAEGLWLSLGRGPIELDPLAFLPHDRGFYYGGYRGAVAEWRESLGYCPTPDARALAGDTVRVLLRLGGALLATGSAPRGDGLNAYTLIDHR